MTVDPAETRHDEHEDEVGRSAHISTGSDDDDAKWMARLSSLSEPEVEALLRGTVPAGNHDLAPVADVARALRRHVLHDDVPAMSDGLRAQLAGEGLVVQLAPRRALRMAAVKAAAAAAAAVVLVGVGASQNSLPAGVQNVVSSAADLVGVEVPRADDRTEVDADEQVEPSQQGSDRARDDEGRTPGGATPADPGTPADGEPATPATPPAHSQDGRTDDVPSGPPAHSSAGGDKVPAPTEPTAGAGSAESPADDAADGGGGHPSDDSVSETGRASRSPKSTR